MFHILYELVCNFMHMHGYIKNNNNDIVQIIHFFQKKFKLYMVLAYIFLKSYISKTCNGFSLYIYIYIYI